MRIAVAAGFGFAFVPVCLNSTLIVLVALVTLANLALGLLPELAGAPVTLQRMLGWCMAPLVWLAGVPWPEAQVAGSLMGSKTILNEFVAYLEMARLPSGRKSSPATVSLISDGMGTHIDSSAAKTKMARYPCAMRNVCSACIPLVCSP